MPTKASVRRSSFVRRAEVSGPTQTRIWARAAGRCVLCATWLIGSMSYLHSTLVGEIAHNTGATTGKRSPRGHSTLSASDRAKEQNLLLLCHACHRMIDDPEAAEYYTTDYLTAKKAEHESRVRSATAFSTLTPVVVMQVTATIRGTYAPASTRQMSESLRLTGLVPSGEDPRDSTIVVEAKDAETASWTWDRGKNLIDTNVDLVHRRLTQTGATTTAVFAIGPIPLLAYLGHRLDDKSDVRLFNRSRTDGVLAWTWPSLEPPAPDFALLSSPADRSATEVVVTAGVSAPIDTERVPSALAPLPMVSLKPTQPPGTDLIASPLGLEAFSNAWRRTLATVESLYPMATLIHVIAAVPATAAIEIGRAHMRDAQPRLAIYQRTSDSYVRALDFR
jgi:hypothetical protein